MRRILGLVAIFSFALSVLLVAAHAQQPTTAGPSSPSSSGSSAPTKVVSGGGGGTYHGPGDALPPASPFPPSGTSCAQPCASDILCAPPQSSCRPCGKKISGAKLSVTWDILPPCMDQSDNIVYEIKIKDLKAACANAGADGIATICMEKLADHCNSGVSRIFIYETLAFQSFPQGVPAADGSKIPVCGLVYQPEIDYGGFCTNLVGQAITPNLNCWVNTLITPGCATGCDEIEGIRLNFSCNCLQSILNVYQAAGLYNPTNPQSYLNDNSVVFSIVVKCCGNEDPCC